MAELTPEDINKILQGMKKHGDFEKSLENLTKTIEENQKALDKQRASGHISDKQYNQERKRIDRDADRSAKLHAKIDKQIENEKTRQRLLEQKRTQDMRRANDRDHRMELEAQARSFADKEKLRKQRYALEKRELAADEQALKRQLVAERGREHRAKLAENSRRAAGEFVAGGAQRRFAGIVDPVHSNRGVLGKVGGGMMDAGDKMKSMAPALGRFGPYGMAAAIAMQTAGAGASALGGAAEFQRTRQRMSRLRAMNFGERPGERASDTIASETGISYGAGLANARVRAAHMGLDVEDTSGAFETLSSSLGDLGSDAYQQMDKNLTKARADYEFAAQDIMDTVTKIAHASGKTQTEVTESVIMIAKGTGKAGTEAAKDLEKIGQATNAIMRAVGPAKTIHLRTMIDQVQRLSDASGSLSANQVALARGTSLFYSIARKGTSEARAMKAGEGLMTGMMNMDQGFGTYLADPIMDILQSQYKGLSKEEKESFDKIKGMSGLTADTKFKYLQESGLLSSEAGLNAVHGLMGGLSKGDIAVQEKMLSAMMGKQIGVDELSTWRDLQKMIDEDPNINTLAEAMDHMKGMGEDEAARAKELQDSLAKLEADPGTLMNVMYEKFLQDTVIAQLNPLNKLLTITNEILKKIPGSGGVDLLASIDAGIERHKKITTVLGDKAYEGLDIKNKTPEQRDFALMEHLKREGRLEDRQKVYSTFSPELREKYAKSEKEKSLQALSGPKMFTSEGHKKYWDMHDLPLEEVEKAILGSNFKATDASQAGMEPAVYEAFSRFKAADAPARSSSGAPEVGETKGGMNPDSSVTLETITRIHAHKVTEMAARVTPGAQSRSNNN